MIWCVDPGAVETGVAGWDGNEHNAVWEQFANPLEVWYSLTELMRLSDTLLVEDYTHGGAFTVEAKRTIEVLGFIRLTAKYHGYTVVVRGKDRRLSGQGPAARVMGDSIAALKKDPKRKDAFSALSHCMTYYREVNG